MVNLRVPLLYRSPDIMRGQKRLNIVEDKVSE